VEVQRGGAGGLCQAGIILGKIVWSDGSFVEKFRQLKGLGEGVVVSNQGVLGESKDEVY